MKFPDAYPLQNVYNGYAIGDCRRRLNIQGYIFLRNGFNRLKYLFILKHSESNCIHSNRSYENFKWKQVNKDKYGVQFPS